MKRGSPSQGKILIVQINLVSQGIVEHLALQTGDGPRDVGAHAGRTAHEDAAALAKVAGKVLEHVRDVGSAVLDVPAVALLDPRHAKGEAHEVLLEQRRRRREAKVKVCLGRPNRDAAAAAVAATAKLDAETELERGLLSRVSRLRRLDVLRRGQGRNVVLVLASQLPLSVDVSVSGVADDGGAALARDALREVVDLLAPEEAADRPLGLGRRRARLSLGRRHEELALDRIERGVLAADA